MKSRSHFDAIVRNLLALAAVSCISTGCGQSENGARGPAPGEIPESIYVAGSRSQTGFAGGTIKSSRSVSAFRITKYPITWSQYAKCVQAGACAEADNAACKREAYKPYLYYRTPNYADKSDNAPATCVGQEQATSYCAWIGGRLATLDEWLVAARGSSPARFSWGSRPTGCDQHPVSPQLIARLPPSPVPASPPTPIGDLPPDSPPDDSARTLAAPAPAPQKASCESADPSRPLSMEVGQHPAGGSPSGMEDVLLAPGELVAGNSNGPFNTCGKSTDRCVVFGGVPAAIDGIEPFLRLGQPAKDGASSQPTVVAHAYALRCVLTASNEVKP